MGSRRVVAEDSALAALLTIVQVASLEVASRDTSTQVPLAGFVIIGSATAVLAVRRVQPVATWAVAVGLTAIYGLSNWPDPTVYLGALIALYTAASLTTVRTAWLIGGVSVLLATTAWLVDPADTDLNDVLTPILAASTAWIAGRAVAGQRSVVRLLEERNRRLVDDRNAENERAVADERLRIARELHDITAHHVSVISVQAEAALADRTQTDAALGAISGSARAAMADLRRMLGVLRGRDGAESRRPQPGLAEIADLIATARATGLSATLELSGPVDHLTEELQLAAHRIVQEALTNVVRHADATSVTVAVTVTDIALQIAVRDDGRPMTQVVEGIGLQGMRERVAIFGGDLTAGPAAGARGFVVDARLPR